MVQRSRSRVDYTSDSQKQGPIKLVQQERCQTRTPGSPCDIWWLTLNDVKASGRLSSDRYLNRDLKTIVHLQTNKETLSATNESVRDSWEAQLQNGNSTLKTQIFPWGIFFFGWITNLSTVRFLLLLAVENNPSRMIQDGNGLEPKRLRTRVPDDAWWAEYEKLREA